MIYPQQQSQPLLFFLLAIIIVSPWSVVDGHGCPAFNISDRATLDQFLALEDAIFPASLKTMIQEYNITTTTLTGVYDCHSGDDVGNEVGVSAVCEPGEDGECFCVALYNFQECSSCALECFDDDDQASRKNITINSFKADCRNVQGGLTDQQCEVDCGFLTTGCLASDNAAVMNATTTTTTTPASPMTNTTMTIGGGGNDKGGDDDKDDKGGNDDKNGTMASSPMASPTASSPTAPTSSSSSSGTVPTATKPTATAASGAATTTTTTGTIMMMMMMFVVVIVGTTTAGLFGM